MAASLQAPPYGGALVDVLLPAGTARLEAAAAAARLPHVVLGNRWPASDPCDAPEQADLIPPTIERPDAPARPTPADNARRIVDALVEREFLLP